MLIKKRLPKDRRDRLTWRHVAAQAAAGGATADVAIALRLALIIERVECLPQRPRRPFPPPWTIDEMKNACFIVRDKNGQQSENGLEKCEFN